MTQLKADLFQDLEFRGIVNQVTDENLGKLLAEKRFTLYCGFDPTSDSLHVGSLLPLVTLQRFQRAGHRVIAVVGGATGMIGDPSGKSAERSLLTEERIERNVEGIRGVVSKFLDLDGENAARVVNNAEWFRGMSYLAFLRDVGKHFTVNHMMAKESVRARLEDREHGISYTEFSYMLLQAYDFYVLNRRDGCDLQIGGSDQWGNITAGCELIRRMRAAHAEPAVETFGLTHPLVTKADGQKFGKTEAGTVWLDAARTSPYQLYQFFIRAADADVMKLLKFFTFLPHEEINRIEDSLKNEPEKRLAQQTLARELTRMVHGEEELKRVEATSKALFEGDLKSMDESTFLEAYSEAPRSTLGRSDVVGAPLVELLNGTLCNSKGAARKDMQGGGIYLNDERVKDPQHTVGESDLIAGKFLLLRKGKKNYHLIQTT